MPRNGSSVGASRLRFVILAAFLVGLVFALGALVFASVRGFALYRQARRTGSVAMRELSEFEERSARTERLLAENERSTEELRAAAERLRVSRARLEVLLRSIERARARTRWVRALLPLP
jgi:hypothetical protein